MSLDLTPEQEVERAAQFQEAMAAAEDGHYQTEFFWYGSIATLIIGDKTRRFVQSFTPDTFADMGLSILNSVMRSASIDKKALMVKIRAFVAFFEAKGL